MQGIKDDNLTGTTLDQSSPEPSPLSGNEDLQRHWQSVVKRRSFLKSIGIAGAALSASAVLGSKSHAHSRPATAGLPKGDAALLRFAAAGELIEADLWQQYNELGGVQGGNPACIAAVSNLDGDMPQYIADNTDDELSHGAFLNAYLISRGEAPVDLDPFRTLPSSQATDAKNISRLTNLMKLNVDLSWYTRYRSKQNADFGLKFKGPFEIRNEPGIPLNDTDTPPDQQQPVPPATPQEARMRAIANTAGFHFAFLEQGGASLYPTLAFKATDPEVLRILVSIGGVEIDHFGLRHDKAGNAVAQPLAGVTDAQTGQTFPDLNVLNSELDHTNLILPEPCTFVSKKLPTCSVIRPTSTEQGGAVATIKTFTDDPLFLGQSTAFFDVVNRLGVEADTVPGGF